MEDNQNYFKNYYYKVVFYTDDTDGPQEDRGFVQAHSFQEAGVKISTYYGEYSLDKVSIEYFDDYSVISVENLEEYFSDRENS